MTVATNGTATVTLPEDRQILITREFDDHVVHGALAAGQEVDDLPPPRLGHRVEHIRCRCCSGHAQQNTFPYRHMSRKP